MQSLSKKILAATALSLFVFLAHSPAHADVVVIANPSLDVSEADVKDIFTGEKLVAGSTKLAPVANKAAESEFLSKVLQMDQAKYEQIWRKKSFRDGLTQPATKANDAEVVDAVKSTPGGVGYVTSAPAGVKVIKKY